MPGKNFIMCFALRVGHKEVETLYEAERIVASHRMVDFDSHGWTKPIALRMQYREVADEIADAAQISETPALEALILAEGDREPALAICENWLS